MAEKNKTFVRFFSLLVLCAIIFSALPLGVLAASETVNLVSGLTYKVETGEPISFSYGINDGGELYGVDNGQITDSDHASLSSDSDGWYRSYKGVSRSFIFDLGAQSSVSYVKAGFLHSKSAGIYAPRYINIWLSDDGKEYGVAAEYQTNYRLSSSTVARYDAVIKLGDDYSARFVKIEICCDELMYCDEIQVFGKKTLSGNEIKVHPSELIPFSGYPQSVAGVSNIVRVQNGYNSENPDFASYNETEFLTYVAYINQTGEIAGTMFDGMIFSPCEGAYPSGGSVARSFDLQGGVMTDWELYIQQTKADLGALDLAAATAYGFIGIDRKFKVFLTIPYPAVMDSAFGDIDGDGLDEYCRTFGERLAVVEWYVDKCVNEFNRQNYSDIVLAGFCWGNSEIDYAISDHEGELVSEMNEYVRNMGLETLFDASYLAIGFDSWKALGFSDAVMQPNAADSHINGFQSGVLAECAGTAFKYQMGVAVETADFWDFEGESYSVHGFNYESYLYNGKIQGYLNGLKIFDQGFGEIYYNWCYADINTPKGQYLRRLYDLTFDFIHLTYSNEPPRLFVESEIELVNGDTKITLNLEWSDEDSHWDDITVEFPETPLNGVVAAAANKKALIYSSDRDFVGEDSFTVRVSDGFGYSEEYEVKVTVVTPESFESSSAEYESSSEDVSASPYHDTEQKIPPWLMIIVIILGGAMVIVSAVMILKSKKKD